MQEIRNSGVVAIIVLKMPVVGEEVAYQTAALTN